MSDKTETSEETRDPSDCEQPVVGHDQGVMDKIVSYEIYHIHHKDDELHAIDVIMEVMHRHLDRSHHGPCNSEENIQQGREAMIRVANYILQRVS
jgi:hypothetical protein